MSYDIEIDKRWIIHLELMASSGWEMSRHSSSLTQMRMGEGEGLRTFSTKIFFSRYLQLDHKIYSTRGSDSSHYSIKFSSSHQGITNERTCERLRHRALS